MAEQATRVHGRVTVYRPRQRHELGFLRTWAVMARNVFESRELIWQLFRRDFLAAYKKSFIGFTWIFISPLAGVMSWVLLNATGVLKPGETGVAYPVYVLVGSTMWGLFMGFYGSAAGTLGAGSDFITQVHYSHEALLFSEGGQHLARFVIALGLNVVALLAVGTGLSWRAVLFPLVALPLFFLGTGLGLVFGMISVVAVDVRRVAGMGFGLLMYLTPIIYTSDVDNAFLRTLNAWNPLTYLVCSARDIMISGTLYQGHFGAAGYAVSAALALVVFLVSWRLFFLGEERLIERMV